MDKPNQSSPVTPKKTPVDKVGISAKNLQNPLFSKGFPLNPEQKAAAEAPASPLLIVAGAGTGKTRTLTSRIIHLVETGTPPERICAVTFTNKAANEMQERIAHGMPPGGNVGASGGGLGNGRGFSGGKPFIGTFHSLGARILRRECRTVGREPNFAIFDDHDSFDLVKKAVKAALPEKAASMPGSVGITGGAAMQEKKNKKEAPARFARKISEMKNFGRAEREKMDEDARRVFDAYESGLQRNNAFDFDDLVEKPVAIFQSHPEILKKYQGMFDAVLVDEYQDINPKQYEFIRLLAGAHKNLTVVGDDEQTIYSWRYADIKIFLNFHKDWENAKVHFLEENYRSTGNIINAASAVVQHNKFRTPKKLWTKAAAGSLITLFEAWGENEEGAWIAQEIVKRRSANAGEEIAILYRTNAQSRAIEQALIRASLPYQIFGGLKFYERREVKDAVAALRYASNKKDELSRERLEKNLSKRKFADFRAAVAGFADPKPTDIIKIFLETFSYFNYLEANFINSDERQENIAELINFAAEFESLPELLERLSLLQSVDAPAGGANAATAAGVKGAPAATGGDADRQKPIFLSTIHLAKGLEFETVFLAGVAEGILPHIRSIDDDASVEEERRLMYVAMTRAKKDLFISFFGMPSRFLGEIPEEYLSIVDMAKFGGGGATNTFGSDDDYHISTDEDW